MRIDVNAWVGPYPFRLVEGGEPEALLDSMAHNGIDQAWISNLAAVFWRDPTEGNEALYRAAESYPSLRPVPAVHPGLANREAVVEEARERSAPAIRVDPLFYGIDPAGADLRAVLARGARLGLPVLMAVKLEDLRQRHPNDHSGDLSPAMIRTLVRTVPDLELIVTHADRDFIEQTVFGSTAAEAARILWEIDWLWGPPTVDLQHLVDTIGFERFCFGTGMPLRIAESAVAKLDLLECPPEARAAIESGNVLRLS